MHGRSRTFRSPTSHALIIATTYLAAPNTGCGEWPETLEADPGETDAGLLEDMTCAAPPYQLIPEGADGNTRRRPGGLARNAGGGSLEACGSLSRKDGAGTGWLLPLEHTDVTIEVSGFVARARVVQKFGNPYQRPLEAVYTFPLPDDAAVDAMTMHVGDRVVQAQIMMREQARQVYSAARDRGQRAALLEQERENIFTQSVANIMPGDEILIEIEYVQVLRYEEGAYEVVFPTMVGPRYVPGGAVGVSGTGWSADTDRVPDGSRITPPILPPGQRSGHDISLTVNLDAGVPIQGLHSISHALSVWEETPSKARIELSPADTVPNKDFVLRYQVAGVAPQVALIPHFDDRGGFFTLIVQPQRDMTTSEITPREIVIIADTSGSMGGFPMEKSKQAMRRILRGMRRSDRFNIVRFSGDTATLFERPLAYSSEHLTRALAFVDDMRGSGGTEMAKGIVEALQQPAAPGYLRIAVLLTDGFVDEDEVLHSIEAGRRSARVFTLGIGSSTNRYLLDRAAILGRGEAFYLRHDEDAREAIDHLFRRIDRPAIRNITIDWKGLDVVELYPSPIPDLFAGQPLYVHGRYWRGGTANVEVSGQLAQGTFSQTVPVVLPTVPTDDTAMASVWARQKIKSLMLDRVRFPGKWAQLRAEITEIGLRFNLMTQWTSFVAVEDGVANPSGELCVAAQPVELPEGVSAAGILGGCGGGSLSGELSNGIGATGIGSATAGLQGLGIRGGGSLTGEGMGTSYGIAGIGTAGRLGGGGMGYGSGVELGSRKDRALIPLSAPLVMGSLPREILQKVIDQNKNQIRTCYEAELQRQQDLEGKVGVKWVIAATGRVAKVMITETSLENGNVEKCIMAKIMTWKFPPPAGGGTVEVNYPFVLRSDRADFSTPAVNENKNQIRYCYERELQRSPDLQGHVDVKLLVDETGKVTSVTVEDSSLASESAESCMVAKIKSWIFPARARKGLIEVNRSFVLQTDP